MRMNACRAMMLATVVLATAQVGFSAVPIGTAFTYQGRLTDGGSPANGDYDFKFGLFDALSGGNQAGSTLSVNQVAVINGLFAVELDFGSQFRGDALWLEIEVAPYKSGVYTLLSPRQELTPTPYAMYAAVAESVPGAITGSGSTSRVPKFTGTRTIGNSTIYDTGTNVGIGSTSPSEKLSVNGIVQSLTGGFKFPDGTIQITAGGGSSLWQQSGNNIYYNLGEVGIGTDNPIRLFEVESQLTSNINPLAVFRRTGAGSTAGIRFENANANHFNLGITGNDELALGYNANIPLAGDFLRITPTGNFGIGTTSPSEKLSVNGIIQSITGGFKFPDGTIQATAGGGSSLWQQSGSDIYFSGGNVGIGNTAPEYELDVGSTAGSLVWLRITSSTSSGIMFHSGDTFHDGAIRYDHNEDFLQFATRPVGGNPYERMRLNTDGYLGIGTTSPNYRLDVGETDDSYNYMRIGAANYAGLLFYDGESSHSGRVYYDHTTDSMSFQTRPASGNPTDRMKITAGGNVGIGASSPGYRLDVGSTAENYNYTRINAASYTGLMFSDGESTHSGMIRYDHTGDFMEFHTKPSGYPAQERMRLTSEGYLGLGKANPTARLHVQSPVAVAAIRVADTSGTDTVTIAGDGVTNLDVTSFQSALQVTNSGSGDSIQASNGSGVVFKVANDGITHVDILAVEGGSDLAERFDVGSGAKPGMVVEIDPDRAGKLRVAQGAYSRLVAGVISGANGVDAGMVLADLPDGRDSQPVALTGRVWVYCDATDRPIGPGDLITTADRPGHAMAVVDHERAQGAVLGKAMTALDEGTGLVLVLVTLQ